MSPSLSPQAVTNQTVRMSAMTQQQLLLQRHQLQQQKQQLLQQQQEQQLQEVCGPRQVLLRQGIIQEDSLTPQQLQMLQRQQPRQLILTQQGKLTQFRQLIQPSGSPQQQLQQASSPMPPSPVINQSPSPMGNVQQYNPSSSPLHPPSPMISPFHPSSSPMPQQSPRMHQQQQQGGYQTANSPMTPQSPMVYSGLQTPTSPMPQGFNQPNSPMPPQSPRVVQPPPPSSPMGSPLLPQQQQFVHQRTISPASSPMPIRRPSSTGGSIASSPQSLDNPRTPQEHHDVNLGLGNGGGGGPGPYNPIPCPPDYTRFTYVKLGLRGGSPMWNDKPAPPRKPMFKGSNVGKVGPLNTSSAPNTPTNNSPEESSKKERGTPGKMPSLVCVDYNDFDEESGTPPVTPPNKPALIKKPDAATVKTRQSEDTDSEITVYDDIVLVEGCNEGNLEVAELQSALEGNVMSTVVSMPMVIDPGHIQMMDVDSLEDCLVRSSNLVVLDDGTVENDCILDGEKDEGDMLNIDDDLGGGLKVDEELMELDEDTPSPPHRRKRLVGKVLPGESIVKEDEKVESETPDSVEEDGTNTSPDERTIQSELETTSSQPNEENSEVFKNVEDKLKKIESDKDSSDKMAKERDRLLSSNIQPNVVVTQTAVTFTPVVTQKSIPVYSERRLSLQQATVASLVQDAVNAAKLATEAQQMQKNVVDSLTVNNNNSIGHFFSRTIGVSPNKTAPTSHLLPLSVVSHKSSDQQGSTIVDKKDLSSQLQKELLVAVSSTASTTPSLHLSSIRTIDGKIAFPQLHETCSTTNTLGLTKLADLLNKTDKSQLLTLDKDPNSKQKIKLENEKDIIEGFNKVKQNIFKMSSEHAESQLNYHQTESASNELAGRSSVVVDSKDTQIGDINLEKRKSESGGPLQQQQQPPTSRIENVTLPAVSSSILEAQLTNMLRSEQNPNQKFTYAIVNYNVGKEIKKEEESGHPDDIKVEGLAAHFRSLKSEDFKRDENKIKIQSNLIKHGNIYVTSAASGSKVKSETVVVDGAHYKLVHSNIHNIENSLSGDKEFLTSLGTQQQPQHIMIKQEGGGVQKVPLTIERRLSNSDINRSDLLQQRIVTSSGGGSGEGEKETHHLSLGGGSVHFTKSLQNKDDMKKFVSLSNMLMPQQQQQRRDRPPEDSQNVLLKKLLQNTACATTTSAGVVTASSSSNSSSVSGGAGAGGTLNAVPSLEAQLARPVPPTPSSLIPPVLTDPHKTPTQQYQQPTTPQSPRTPMVSYTTPSFTHLPHRDGHLFK